MQLNTKALYQNSKSAGTVYFRGSSNREWRITMRINHNISAQLTNVSLKKVDNKVSASLERLSTGYKINKAADDSAGMAISQ